MTTVKAKYLGDLRLECTHLQSGTKIITDAPTDNNGKGEAFSPTDLCSTSLAACAMTIMGIYAKNNGIHFFHKRGHRFPIQHIPNHPSHPGYGIFR